MIITCSYIPSLWGPLTFTHCGQSSPSVKPQPSPDVIFVKPHSHPHNCHLWCFHLSLPPHRLTVDGKLLLREECWVRELEGMTAIPLCVGPSPEPAEGSLGARCWRTSRWLTVSAGRPVSRWILDPEGDRVRWSTAERSRVWSCGATC